MVMLVLPMPLDEVIESIPATVANWRSSGVATAEAMVSGLAPGSAAFTCRVGKSTLGRSLTGSARYPAMPNKMIPIISNAVITGRLMKMAVMFMPRRNLSAYSRTGSKGRDTPERAGETAVYLGRQGVGSQPEASDCFLKV